MTESAPQSSPQSSPASTPAGAIIVQLSQQPGTQLAPGNFGSDFAVTQEARFTERDLAANFALKVENIVRQEISRLRKDLEVTKRELDAECAARDKFLTSYLETTYAADLTGTDPIDDTGFPWSQSIVAAFRGLVASMRNSGIDPVVEYSALCYHPKVGRIVGTISLSGARRDPIEAIGGPCSWSTDLDFELTYRGTAPGELVAHYTRIEELTKEIETTQRQINKLRADLGNVDYLERQARASLVEGAVADNAKTKAILDNLCTQSNIQNALESLGGY